MLYWFLAVPVLALLILTHEIGHFFAARWMKVRVEEFGFGLPPRALTLTVRKGIIYSLNWLPVGGFVRLAGETDSEVEGGLAQKKPGPRAIVLGAGALMNLLLAFLLFTTQALIPHDVVVLNRVGVLFIAPGSPAALGGLQDKDILLTINGKPVNNEEVLLEFKMNAGRETILTVDRGGQTLTLMVTPTVGTEYGQDQIGVGLYLHEGAATLDVIPDKPAYLAGLRSGDLIVELNGETIHNNLDFWALQDRLRKERETLVFTVQRNGRVQPPIVIPPLPVDAADQTIGISYGTPRERVRLSLWESAQQGARTTVDAVLLVPRILSAIFRGSIPVTELSGPVGIVDAVQQVAKSEGLSGLLNLTGMLSANLFVVNLLPLPALDGGRLAFVLLECLRGGRKIPRRWEGWVHAIGMALLLGLLALVSIFDVLRFVHP